MTTLEHLELAREFARNQARLCHLDDTWTSRLENYGSVLCRKYGTSQQGRETVNRLIAHRARAFREEPQIGGNVSLLIKRTTWLATDEINQTNPTPPEAA